MRIPRRQAEPDVNPVNAPEEADEGVQGVEDFIKPAAAAKERRRKRLGHHGKMKRAAEVARKVLDEANAEVDPAVVWDQVNAGTVLGLYAVLHEKVYGVFPGSVTDGEFDVAARTAGSVCQKSFRGSWYEVVKFMRWVWQREVGREKIRAARGQTDVKTIRPTFMFSRYLLEDYETAMVRTRRVRR